MAVTILDIGYSNISLSLYLEAELIAGTGLKTYQFLKAEPYFFESIVLKSLRYLEEFSFEVVSVISIIIFSNSLIRNSHLRSWCIYNFHTPKQLFSAAMLHY